MQEYNRKLAYLVVSCSFRGSRFKDTAADFLDIKPKPRDSLIFQRKGIFS